MRISNIVKENLVIDSKEYTSLTPIQKEVVKEVLNLYDKEEGTVVDRFEQAIKKVCKLHNINEKQINAYFQKEALTQMGV